MTHWRTTFDPDDGTPTGALCDCDIGDDHDGAGNVMFPLFPLNPDTRDKLGHGDT